jgi:hypothetical protein
VNSEVKKLLVASVGEDIEAKVDYLTQDKARLAADMRQFSFQVPGDNFCSFSRSTNKAFGCHSERLDNLDVGIEMLYHWRLLRIRPYIGEVHLGRVTFFLTQISKDFEEKEKLSVQSDVWKSKFLACRCKSNLLTYSQYFY